MEQQPQLPEKIDKYQVLSVLGKGAMGIVYHAYDPVVKRDVAIKFLSALDVEETELISRFEREARLAGGLRHPNIVTIHDLGHFEGRPYIVMEYIVGRDLEHIIREKVDLTVEQKLEIILQICKGLDAAHQKGIIHRDIKPANIRIQEDNTVKIMDFGIARMGASQLTRSGYIIGTLQYMSPEQISGEQLDPRTDLFSLGLIAYELFTGTNPYAGGAAVDIMYRILNVRPAPIEQLPEEYGTELNQIIVRALEKNRDLRYPNAKEMAKELEELVFYIKSLKFRPRMTERVKPQPGPSTQNMPAADRAPAAATQLRKTSIPPTVAMDMQNPPAFGVDQKTQEKAPRTGIGANYSETAQQQLMKPQTSEKKFYVLGALVAIAFIAGLFYFASMRGTSSRLDVTSSPTGAQVLRNGILLGTTPLTIEEKSNMTLTFKLKGYQDRTYPLSVDAWPTQINAQLEPAKVESTTTTTTATTATEPGKLSISSSPSGATILVDGQESGKTPAEIALPDDQPHKLTLKLDGYDIAEQTVKRTDPALTIALNQAATPGFVRYTGRYPVSLIVDGKYIAGNPVQVMPGTHTVLMKSRKDAFIRSSRRVEVTAGGTVTVGDPEMGTIKVIAQPSNCKISIDGEFIDLAPIVNLPISAGDHTIGFNWEKLGKKRSKSTTIDAGATSTVTASSEGSDES